MDYKMTIPQALYRLTNISNFIKNHPMSHAGVLGIVKSIYHSMEFTTSPTSIIIHSNVLTEIDPSTTFDINGRIRVGISKWTSFAKMAKSHFRTTDGGIVNHTGKEFAKIGPISKVHIGGNFEIGDSFFTSYAYISCEDRISIGDNVAIGPNCMISDCDYHTLYVNDKPRVNAKPIDINDNVWIGSNVSIKKGVEIKSGSVVAGDSVVTSDIPPNSLAAGCPAEIIENDVTWE